MSDQRRWLFPRTVAGWMVISLLLMSTLPVSAQATQTATKPVKASRSSPVKASRSSRSMPQTGKPSRKTTGQKVSPTTARRDTRQTPPGPPHRTGRPQKTSSANRNAGSQVVSGKVSGKGSTHKAPVGRQSPTNNVTAKPPLTLHTGRRSAAAPPLATSSRALRGRAAPVSVARTATASRNAKPHRDYNTRATAVRRTAMRAETDRTLRRRAEQARLTALARVRALDEHLQQATQSNIKRDDLRGEDPAIRQLALDALGDRAGTVVVMEPGTGRVLSIVNQQWAVRTPFKPCSTIKVLTGYAALQEKLTTADEVIPAANQSWSLRTALSQSNNEYFQVLVRRLGFERFLHYARQAGFGRKTGINLARETSGVIPRHPPADLGRMGSHGDGFGVTAVQLATFISTIANGGTLYRPQILRTPQEIARFRPIPVQRLPLTEDIRRDLLAGLVSAVENGTARRSGTAALGVAGKTGSCLCDFSPRTRVGLFASFVDAPGKPGLLVTVITKGSTARGSSASVIAGAIYHGTEMSSRRLSRQRIVPTTESVDTTGVLDAAEAND